MSKTLFFSLSVASAVSLAACTSPVEMAPSHIASLHSGSMVVAIPKRSHITLAPPRSVSAGNIAEFAVIDLLFGNAAGSLGEANLVAGMQARQGNYAEDLGPYSRLFWSLYPKRRFMDVARSVADHVPWMGRNPSVELYGKAGAPGSGYMSHLAQSVATQAVILVKYKLGFSADLERLAAVAQVEVYAKGIRRGQLIDSAIFKESTRLTDTGPSLKPYGYEGIAAGTQNDRAARGARANVWMADGGNRYKVAVADDMSRLRADLTNFLNGRPASG